MHHIYIESILISLDEYARQDFFFKELSYLNTILLIVVFYIVTSFPPPSSTQNIYLNNEHKQQH